ncbi:MAG: M20/M25/M40 family metallo-hydrolase [Gemmatimonadaceae bacterium]
MRADRTAAEQKWAARLRATGALLQLGTGTLGKRLEQAGAAGIIASRWSNGWGVNKIFDTKNERAPALDLSCEDYGLLFRLAENIQGPIVRVRAESEFLGEVPAFNTIAEIKGIEKPDEYVMLSAHFDSWDGGSGATDNGTGTITMMEAMRVLKAVYPRPKRTILVGHWSGEEQRLNGSRSFAADHPEVVRGLHALFNQDNGTGRVSNISMQGFTGAGANFTRWAVHLPLEISRHISWIFPGAPSGGGSDSASFVCHGAPAFGLGSNSWEYGTYTWHTNRDTFDKIVWDDLKNNATLVAMLVYLASEDPDRVPRDRRIFSPGAPAQAAPGGFPQPSEWPKCVTPARTSSQSTR